MIAIYVLNGEAELRDSHVLNGQASFKTRMF